MIDIMLCREWREISLTVLLVNCHDVTGRIFRPVNFAPNRYDKSFKWRNQPGKKYRTSRKSTYHIAKPNRTDSFGVGWLSPKGPVICLFLFQLWNAVTFAKMGQLSRI